MHCIERPEKANLWKSCLWGWSLADIWEHGYWDGSLHFLTRMAHLLACGPMWFMLNTCFPSGSLEIWYMLGRKCPPQNSGCWFSNELLWLTTFHRCCHNCSREIKKSYVTALREDSGSLHLVSSRLRPDVPFPFADFALYPFAVTKVMSTTICWVPWVSLVNAQIWGWFGDPQNTGKLHFTDKTKLNLGY